MLDYLAELSAKLGPAVSTDPQICRAYNHDLGEMPRLLLMLFKRTPAVVALPRTADEVRAALTIAHCHQVPVTPRAQASSGYGGSMPTRGGLLLDVSRMNKVLATDREHKSCDVEPGVVWTDLELKLARDGLALCICPTSGPSSTVGGMFAMGGMGIGSLKYGSILDVITEIDVVDPDGRLHTESGDALSLYAFSQGALGVITRLRLKCRDNTPLVPVALQVMRSGDVAPLVRELARLGAFSASVLSASYCVMQAQANGERSSPIGSGSLVLAVFEGEPDAPALADCLVRCKAVRLADDVAKEEWERRFYSMRIKRNGPALLVGEYVVDFDRYGPVCEKIIRRLPNDRIGFEAFANRTGQLAVLIYIQDSAEDLLSLFRMGKAMVPLHVAAKHGGTVYATGLWFNSQTGRVLGKTRMQRFMHKKRELDPKNLMNPGKCCGSGKYFWPFALLSWGIWIGTIFLGPISSLLKARPRCIRTHEEA